MNMVKKFLKHESASGMLLMLALILAMIAENSPLNKYYNLLLDMEVLFKVGGFELAKPLLLWINDALMAIFFFVVGLELKREVLTGQLSSKEQIVLPVAAAIAGIIIPALIYYFINQDDPIAMQGWAIPCATDIAFALGVLALLGDRVPKSLKLFLLAVAIFDDIGAILIIALFYSANITISMLALAAIAMLVLYIFNRKIISSAAPYLLIGIILWVAVLKSGVHATLAGILLAIFIPMKTNVPNEQPLLIKLENDLHTTVAYIILPVFAFANAGISLEGLEFSSLLEPIPLGIALGLIVGKQIGIFGSIFALVKLKLAKLPEKVSWGQIYGLSVICGIGFTMSLFISSLAFEQSGDDHVLNDRLGIIVGSLICALWGYLTLWYVNRKSTK